MRRKRRIMVVGDWRILSFDDYDLWVGAVMWMEGHVFDALVWVAWRCV
jgi:hypothetical protein